MIFLLSFRSPAPIGPARLGPRSRGAFTALALPLVFAILPVSSTKAEPEAGPFDLPRLLAELRDHSAAGVDRRLGPGYEDYHPADLERSFPEIFLAPPKALPAEAGPEATRSYQLGGPWTKDAGDFSSTQGQVLYAPDQPLRIDPATHQPNQGMGVDRVTIIEMAHGCFTEKPEPPWWGGFRPDPDSSWWLQAAGGKIGSVGSPVALARGMGNWANSGLVVFSSGLIAATGTVTGHGTNPTFMLPPHKVPTAISITNKNEFALVTLVDTDAKQGQVAVFALSSGGRISHMPHEWSDENPGLANVAVFTHLKLLGYVDLSGMVFPTGISAAANRTEGRVNGRDGNAGMLSEYDLAVQADRDNFHHGFNAGYVATGGFAVVIAKAENRVAFLDLRALFEAMRSAYLTTEENYRQTRSLGDGPGQWPFTFDEQPGWRPRVVKILPVSRPTAALARMNEGPGAQAVVAGEDGTLQFFQLEGAAAPPPNAAPSIRLIHTLAAGRNPVCLAYPKHYGDGFIVVSRGDREIEWISDWSGQARVTRRLRDRRLIDPVFAEVADTHGIEGPLVTVADFKGRQILNYRFGDLRFATQGGAQFGLGSTGRDSFECGGSLPLPGCPFAISATNVN